VSFLNAVGKPGADVVFLIDSRVDSYGLIGVHPNDNTATVVFAPQEIPKIWDYCGVSYKYLSLYAE
jgi:hypothetical protein